MKGVLGSALFCIATIVFAGSSVSQAEEFRVEKNYWGDGYRIEDRYGRTIGRIEKDHFGDGYRLQDRYDRTKGKLDPKFGGGYDIEDRYGRRRGELSEGFSGWDIEDRYGRRVGKGRKDYFDRYRFESAPGKEEEFLELLDPDEE